VKVRTSKRYKAGEIPGPGNIRLGMVFKGHSKKTVKVVELAGDIVHVLAGKTRYKYLLQLVESWPLLEDYVTIEA
jgi:hypothetical protein